MNVTADVSCELFRHIYATDEQRAALKSNKALWLTLVTQVVDNNDAYDLHCLGPDAPKPVGSGGAP
jgi:hypothetical protein